MKRTPKFSTMRRHKHWLLFLTFFSILTPNCHLQQLETPSGGDNEDYLPAELGRGIGSLSDQNQVPQRSRYPNRSKSYSNFDPGADFRNYNNNNNNGFRGTNSNQPRTQSFPYEPFPTNNNSRSNVIVTRRTTSTTIKTTERTTVRPGDKPSRSPFDDPNRYRVPQTRQQSDQVRFVNGRPYK